MNVVSTFGAAFDKLPTETQRGITWALTLRRSRYLRSMNLEDIKTKVILIGDTPGPGRPDDPKYHHTPFYSTKNSSLWLNRQLVDAGVDEDDLVWFNALLADGKPLDHAVIASLIRFNPAAKIICLGGKAEDWARRNAPTSEHYKVFHPQFAKRFKSKEPYALIDLLKKFLDLEMTKSNLVTCYNDNIA